jgi:hypothetical protein
MANAETKPETKPGAKDKKPRRDRKCPIRKAQTILAEIEKRITADESVDKTAPEKLKVKEIIGLGNVAAKILRVLREIDKEEAQQNKKSKVKSDTPFSL